MIQSKKDLIHYLKEDMKASKRKSYNKSSFTDVIWKYQIHMRKAEYYLNTKSNIFKKAMFQYQKTMYRMLGILLSFQIPLNSWEERLYLPHRGTIMVSQHSKIGNNCTINMDVNIGKPPYGESKAPILKNNIYIARGVKIYGDIIIESGIAIGANAVVNKSFTDQYITIAGVLATKISPTGTKNFNS